MGDLKKYVPVFPVKQGVQGGDALVPETVQEITIQREVHR